MDEIDDFDEPEEIKRNYICEECQIRFDVIIEIIRGCADFVDLKCPLCKGILGSIRHDGYSSIEINNIRQLNKKITTKKVVKNKSST